MADGDTQQQPAAAATAPVVSKGSDAPKVSDELTWSAYAHVIDGATPRGRNFPIAQVLRAHMGITDDEQTVSKSKADAALAVLLKE